MSTPAPPPSKAAKKREKKSGGGAPPAPRLLKVVVRRLPADLPADVFWASVARWAPPERVAWRAFYPGKARKRCVRLRAGRE
jgi:regulator of nonsense transcripts 3